ncbi:MAG: magnesium/cobalt transporter CorA [candidate division KSB1 bacterium]|nr:magnesium/cobalt transporter CorA [candidate division KSB1 bacterium]MDZ7301510.1 magnesium/cobalt transporter CorA [candidate division KSB1 bacterium]MDZ7310912.1 magnesium/cobalt transporter CorA [candidate division KSB1 bacterium]
MLHCYYHTSDGKVALGNEIATLRQAFQEGTLYWLDLEDPTESEEETLWEIFNFHPLAIEDCIATHQDPKIDDYGDYLYIIVHGVDYSKSDSTFRTTELDIFLTPQFLLTFHYQPLRTMTQWRLRFKEGAVPLDRRPAFLLHQLLDNLVQNYAPAMEAFEKRISNIEEIIIKKPDPRVLDRIFQFKKEALNLKRILGPQRDVINRLGRGEFRLIPAELKAYFRDVYDEISRYAEIAEGQRDTIMMALDAYLSSSSNRLNEIMRALTLISTIFLPLTFITGLFGMNFEVIPYSKHPFGFYMTIIVSVLVAIGMFFYFKFKRYI